MASQRKEENFIICQVILQNDTFYKLTVTYSSSKIGEKSYYDFKKNKENLKKSEIPSLMKKCSYNSLKDLLFLLESKSEVEYVPQKSY
ncbi:hypothetical protein BpHYR1_036016 [Brachionus plicatilis]|uniref:Uncharacterized protein n=1 Tax=Brachionus plicatilis TaxID=10195 RepID=A0A3M7SY96_BRAPC|nr:hypothetical protein BpHYR1_036016 [Brachionus plicatilis]